MRDNIKFRIGLFISTLFILAFIFNCRTAKNLVQKSKGEFRKEELKIEKLDSTTDISKLSKFDNSFNSKWSEFWNKYDATFTGESNEDTFEFTFTENGFTAKGKGSINLKSENQKKDSVSNKKVDEIINHQTKINSNSESKVNIEEEKSKVDKVKENKSSGFNWNFTIILIVGVVVVIVLFWKFGLPKFKS